MEGGRRPEPPQPGPPWDGLVFTGSDLTYAQVVKILAEGEEEGEEGVGIGVIGEEGVGIWDEHM